jgi:nitroimidazol reductase NimA-like FMN-containing flavoprotein (pyridoxamine 5'-phosphate oxidase superfamily)
VSYRIVAGLLVWSFVTGTVANAEEPRSIGQDGRIVLGPPIKPDQARSENHPRFPPGWTCAECHDVSFGTDFVSTASRQYWNNYKHLSNAQIWERIVKFLPGRERFAMATVYRNRPTNTTIDLVLDKEERVFYAVSEVGTEKLFHLKRNARVSAVRAEGWTVAEGGVRQWTSVQISGTSEVITALRHPAHHADRHRVLRHDAARRWPVSVSVLEPRRPGRAPPRDLCFLPGHGRLPQIGGSPAGIGHRSRGPEGRFTYPRSRCPIGCWAARARPWPRRRAAARSRA